MGTETLYKGEVETFHAAVVTKIAPIQHRVKGELKTFGVAAYIRVLDASLRWNNRQFRFWLEKGPNRTGNRRAIAWSKSGHVMIVGRDRFSVKVGDTVWVRAPEKREQHSLAPVYSDRALQELEHQKPLMSQSFFVPPPSITVTRRRKKANSHNRR